VPDKKVPDPGRKARAFAEGLLSGLPIEAAETQRSLADINQAVAWLVGLSSGLLVLAIASPGRIPAEMSSAIQIVAALLVVSITAGAAVRVLNLWLASLAGWSRTHLTGWLIGITTEHDRIELLSESWTVETIAEKMASQFNLDLRWPQSAPIEAYRRVYESLYSAWHTSEEKSFRRLSIAAGAHYGHSERRVTKAEAGDNWGRVRLVARLRLALAIVALVFFSVSVFAYGSAMFLIGRAVWNAAP
jgi:hypothetical protein